MKAGIAPVAELYEKVYAKALESAVSYLPDPSDRLAVEAAERYAAACGQEAIAAQEWEAAGRPIVTSHSNGISGAHPAYRAVVEAARQSDRMFRSVPRGARRKGPANTVGDQIARHTRRAKLKPMPPL